MGQEQTRRRIDYWRMAWKSRREATLDLWKPRRTLPPLLIACGHALYNALRNPTQKQNSYNEMWVAILIIVAVYAFLSAAHYAYQTLRNFVVISPADLHAEQNNRITELANARDSSYEAQSEKIKLLEAKIKELEANAKAEADRRKVKLSASLRTEDSVKNLLMKMSSQFSSDQLVNAHVSQMTLMIYSHGEKPVRLRGYKLWKLHATESTRQFPLHGVVTLDAPASVELTEPLLRVISGQEQYRFESLPGKYTIRLVVTYSEDSNPADSQPFDFEVTCRQAAGGEIRIVAEEIGQ